MTRAMTRTRTLVLLLAVTFLGLASRSAYADGAVYAMSNALGNNEVLVYQRAVDGTLTLVQRAWTGGGGSGIQLDPTDSLGSQGGLMLDRDNKFLFAVNTESLAQDLRDGTDTGDCQEGTISSFRVEKDGFLGPAKRAPSGGLFPNSLTEHNGLLYVLNAGGPGLNPVCGIEPNITGFRITKEGGLVPLGSFRIDPGTSPGSFLNCDPGSGPFPTDEFRCGLNPPAFPRSPGQIGFTPDGNALVVTVKGTNTIYVFPVEKDGTPGTPTIRQAGGPNQPTYFGFAFDRRGHLIVSEPFGATPTIPAVPFSAVSSFAISDSGDLQVISASVANGQGTSCWIALDPRAGRFAYVSNNATSNISAYLVGVDGSLTLLDASAAAANLPNDLAVAREGSAMFLYVLNAGNGTIGAFRINGNGSLTDLGAFGGLPIDAGAQGLAAF